MVHSADMVVEGAAAPAAAAVEVDVPPVGGAPPVPDEPSVPAAMAIMECKNASLVY